MFYEANETKRSIIKVFYLVTTLTEHQSNEDFLLDLICSSSNIPLFLSIIVSQTSDGNTKCADSLFGV